MKRLMIKYTIEIDEKDLDKFCFKQRVGRNEASWKFKELAETHGKASVFGYLLNILERR